MFLTSLFLFDEVAFVDDESVSPAASISASEVDPDASKAVVF